MKRTVALLDYDGYICKAYYAGLKDNEQFKVLTDLVQSAIDRTAEYFNVDRDDVEVIRVISGHTFKKDIYPSYKLTRKKDENLGKFREYIKYKLRDELTCVQNLEADDVLILLQKHLNMEDNCIVFSDDKDLRYYSYRYCKLNTDNEVQTNDLEALMNIYAQMLAGDSEDNVKGIPRMGMKTALKYLNENINPNEDIIKTVIRCYRDKKIDIDNCLRDILLVLPVGCMYLKDFDTPLLLTTALLEQTKDLDIDLITARMISDQLISLNKIVKEVYLEKMD